jgi:hypothetical protein
MNYCSDMRTRTPIRVLLTIALTLAFLPMLSTFAPGGQVAGFTTASPAAADQMWYQSVGRASATVACEKSTTTELAAGWTIWVPSWGQWVNGGKGGFVCNRHITWAYDSVLPSSSGSSSVTCATGGGASGTCVLGATGPGGGIVFYVNDSNATGSRYMEAATADLSSIRWTTSAATCYASGGTTANQNCETNNLYPGTVGDQAASTAASLPVGMGAANTTAIIARMNAGSVATNAYAAGLARAYTGGGKTDWFLPSKDELNQLYLQKTVVGGFAADYYWSSSQDDAGLAWSQPFDNRNQYRSSKYSSLNVRPVRAF